VNRATSDSPAAVASDEKKAAAIFQLFGFEPRTESLLWRVTLSQACVERSDQPLGVCGPHGFSRNG
jgi:hypothetical protein